MIFRKYTLLSSALLVLLLSSSNMANASSCGWLVRPISDVITDKTVVFTGKPVYFSQKMKPGSFPWLSTVFKIEKMYKGEIGEYGNYTKIYHNRQNYELPYQVGVSYFIVAQTQVNGDLFREEVGDCGHYYSDDDIKKYIKTGNADNFIPRECTWILRRAYKSEFIGGSGLSPKEKCQRYLPAFKREYPGVSSIYDGVK